jgi:DNA-directed RNA polymerase subunit RPC12/RpoP
MKCEYCEGTIIYKLGNSVEPARTVCMACGREPKEKEEKMEPKKKCPRCGEEKPATKEFFGGNRSATDGLNYWCKDCKSKYQAGKYKKDHGGSPKKARDFKGEYKHRKIREKKDVSPVHQASDTILLDQQILKAIKRSVAKEIMGIIEERFV